MRIKHATASTFVFVHVDAGWRLGVIEHPRLGMVMIPGGHVEDDETAGEAAVREVVEETGLRVQLIDGPAAGLPVGYPHRRVPQPWWITEIDVLADNHLDQPHVHVDHLFVALAERVEPIGMAAHPFMWLGAEQVATHERVYEDTKILAKELFAVVDNVMGPLTQRRAAR